MSEVTALFRPRAVRLPGDLRSLARQYMQRLEAQNLAANTVAAYRRDLEQLVGYLAERDVSLIQIVTDEHLEGFARALLHGEGNKPRTVARKIESVRGLFRFAAGRGLVGRDNAGERAVAPKWHATPPDAPATARLLEMIARIPRDPMGLRDRAAFRLMLDGAMRVEAVASLDCYDDRAPPVCYVHPNGRVRYRAKGGAIKETVVGAATVQAVAEWMDARAEWRGNRREAALFLSERGHRVSRQVLHQRIKIAGAAAGMPELHCHLLRHRRARDVIDQAGLATGNHLLGHARQSTTADMYGEHSAELLRARVRGLPLDEGEVA